MPPPDGVPAGSIPEAFYAWAESLVGEGGGGYEIDEWAIVGTAIGYRTEGPGLLRIRYVEIPDAGDTLDAGTLPEPAWPSQLRTIGPCPVGIDLDGTPSLGFCAVEVDDDGTVSLVQLGDTLTGKCLAQPVGLTVPLT